MTGSQKYARRLYSSGIIKWYRSIKPDVLLRAILFGFLVVMMLFHIDGARAEEVPIDTRGVGVLPYCVPTEVSSERWGLSAAWLGGYCGASVAGIASALAYTGAICVPEDLSVYDLIGVVTREYMANESKELLEQQFIPTVVLMLERVYECKGSIDPRGQATKPHNVMGETK